ncbi:ATP-binding cassette domain-containing protein [Phytoactinopolyspora alkaliphila]|uniref:ATP-binding cassette domain-containing protein n=1 Tax=Phytoactinopolyspora alkaliphila TaxID=1783498 RepID=A0A6N9YKA2_9ACTN|nr:ATP-binding cassette domain-containing protein [Phytoactinopolyspora alkaliphila]NED95340.1 ATP-binding cassette domain-containing protein [Phytoactinopolyspora alkaliphila]
MIRTQNLTRRFTLKKETVEAVRGIDVDVQPGELVAFLGPNGAGKSTTLRMLTTLLPPSAGTAEVAGFDVVRDPVEVRRRIGHIGQGNGSLDGLRMNEELTIQGRFHGLDRTTARARAAELLDRLDLSEQADRDVARLSGGQRRRLDVAMGLIHRPRLVFLDEPSAGLDPHSRANLLEHIRRLHRDDEVTIVLTTHYLDEADAVAERVVVIDNGRIIADGTPDQLKSKVSGDLVTVALAENDDSGAARDVASRVPTAHDVEAGDSRLSFRVENGDAVLPDVVRALDSAGITLRSAQVKRPTLDDVFLTLTGRSLRDDD